MKLLILTLFLGCTISSNAQFLDPLFNSTGQRTFWFNPAAVGTWNVYGVGVTNQMIFYGADQSPYSLKVNAAFKGIHLKTKGGKNTWGKVAIGANYNHVRWVGINEQSFTLQGNFQFRLPSSYISVGISPELHHIHMDSDFFPSDPAFPVGDIRQTRFTMGVGINWFDENFTLGAAIRHAGEPLYNEFGFAFPKRLYFNGAYTFSIVPYFKLRPTYIMSFTGSFVSATGMLNIIFAKNDLTFALGYRNTSIYLTGVSARLGKLYAGYFYGLGTSALTKSGIHTHEIRLAYELFDYKLRPIDPIGSSNF